MSRVKIIWICLVLLVVPACKKLPFVPDDTAILILSALPGTIFSGETAKVTITGTKESGYPLPDGTVVYLGVDYGYIDSEVELTGGTADVFYQSEEDFSGVVTVTARSGNAASEPLTIAVVAVVEPDVVYLFAAANPAHLTAGSGRSTITVQALDGEMLPLAGKNIWVSTTAGTLSGSGLLTTGTDGRVQTTLNTDRTAVVTANYKDKSATVTVTVEEGSDE